MFLSFYRDQIDIQKDSDEKSPEQNLYTGTYTWNWLKDSNLQTPWGTFSADLLPAEQISISTGEKHTILLDADGIDKAFFISAKKSGDTMIPLGKNHAKKCKKIFTDAHVTAEQQAAIPFLRTESGNIIWMTGIRRSNFAITTNKTQKVLQIKFTAANTPDSL